MPFISHLISENYLMSLNLSKSLYISEFGQCLLGQLPGFLEDALLLWISDLQVPWDGWYLLSLATYDTLSASWLLSGSLSLTGVTLLGSPLGHSTLALGKHTSICALLSSGGTAPSQDSFQGHNLGQRASHSHSSSDYSSGLSPSVSHLPINSNQALGVLFCNPHLTWVIVRKNQHLNFPPGW